MLWSEDLDPIEVRIEAYGLGRMASQYGEKDSVEIPYDILMKVMNRIINEVRGVNRVLYDLTSKPPGTVELE